MLKLHTYQMECVSSPLGERIIAKLTTNERWPEADRAKHILLVEKKLESLPIGFAAYFVLRKDSALVPTASLPPNVFVLPDEQSYLSTGDVIKLAPQKPGLQTI